MARALTATGDNDSTINFAEANLANADMSGATLTAEAGGSYSGDGDDAATINFAEANLANADMSGSTLTATGDNDATINFTEANLANANLNCWTLTADTIVGLGPPCADTSKTCKKNKCKKYKPKKKQTCQTTCDVAPPGNKCDCFKEDAKTGSKKCKIKNCCKNPKSAQKCKDKCKKDAKKKKPRCQKTCCNAS